MEEKKCNEGEMGSGDSDDEFYNVKLPCTPTVTTDKLPEKFEVKKVYSPSRTKVKYDYKFDSSSDDETENKNIKRENKDNSKTKDYCDSNNVKKEEVIKEEIANENKSKLQHTYKVVEKINEELKNIKNSNSKTVVEKTDKIVTNQSSLTALPSTMSVPRPQIGVVPPVVVVPPMVVPQGPVVNMGPMIVSPSVGVGGHNILPGPMMGMGGNILRGPSPIGGIMTNSSSAMPSSMIGMNAVSGIMGMPGNIVNLPGQGNVMGLQTGIMNSAIGGINMPITGNMMRMATAGSTMLHMQRPSTGVIGVQNSNNLMALQRPNSNFIGITRPVSVSGPSSNILNIPSPASNTISNSSGMVVSPGTVINNPLVGNPGSLMVMSGVMSNMGTSSLVGTTQTNILANQGNTLVSNNAVRLLGNVQGNSSIRPVPPPPFLNIRHGQPALVNLKWPTNPKAPGNLSNNASSSTSVPVSCYNNLSPASNQIDGDELSRDDKDICLSDRSSNLETDESQSPPRELPNTFKNDGSFMEIFKKMKDEKNQNMSGNSEKIADLNEASSILKKPSVILTGIVGKRRGGRVLKTGLVKKVKKENEAEEEKNPKDAWSMYMAEVKKYREASCEEEGKTRPLVK